MIDERYSDAKKAAVEPGAEVSTSNAE